MGIAALTFSAAFPVYAQSSAAATEIRFQELEREIRRLTGQLEEQNFEVRRLKDELRTVQSELSALKQGGEVASQSDNGLRPSDYAGAGGDDPASVPSTTGDAENVANLDTASGSVQTLGTLVKKDEQSEPFASTSSANSAPRAYDYAYSFIKARDFNRAEAEFAGFLRDYPDHNLASNAQYWFGETFYVRKDYDRSAVEFAKGYQRYPEGPKAASNLLKLGMSLVGLNKNEEACIAFKQLKSEYANSSVPVLKRADSEMQKIDCQ